MLALLQFDCASLPLIDAMLAAGRLPALDGLRRRGAWHALDARATLLQSAVHPTLYTGVDVRRHGLYSLFPWSAADQRARFAHTFPRPPTIWDRLTRCHRRSLVVDPYLAWAPREIDGLFLSGWHFEDRMTLQPCSRPAPVRRALVRRYGRPPALDDVYGRPQAAALFALRDQLVSAPQRAAEAIVDLLRRQRFDLLWLNFSTAHKAGHHLWDAAAVIDGAERRDAGDALRAGLADAYAAIDRAMGRVLEALPADADLIAFSPTGMGPNTSRADLLPGMLDAVLSGKPAHLAAGSAGRAAPIWSLRSKIPRQWRSRIARALPNRLVADMTTRLYLRADWTLTRAIAVPGENTGYVRLNLRGRERNGLVEPAEAPALLDAIAEGLATFRDADGSPSIARVERMAELAGEAYAERLPDLVIQWGERPAAQLSHVSSPRFGSVARHGAGSGRSGNHNDDAWAVVVPGRSQAVDIGRVPRVTDIGATACALFGADMTGLSGTSLLAPFDVGPAQAS